MGGGTMPSIGESLDKVNQFIDIVLTFVERMWVEMLILLSLTH